MFWRKSSINSNKSLMTECNLNCSQRSSPYGAVKTLAQLQQDRQCTYNVTLRRVSWTIVAQKSNKYYIFCACVCSLSIQYAMCMRQPYHHLWPARVYDIFLHYLINDTIFEQKVIGHKMRVLIFSTTPVRNISRSKNWVIYDQVCILVIMYSTRNLSFLSRFSKKKILKYKISWKCF